MSKIFNIIISADIHGNKIQYNKLFKESEKYDALIIAGDLAPKSKKLRTVEEQMKFMEEFLFPAIKKFKIKSKCEIFLILGNDDFKKLDELCEKNQRIGYKYISSKKIKLIDNFHIAGYSYVPLNPFIYKDWQKLDSIIHEKKYREFLIKGTINNGELTISYNLENRKDTIEKDLEKLNIDKNTILICHTPPYKTNLDVIKNGKNVGSLGVKNIIEQKKPYLSFHGHIHESFGMTGIFKEKLNETTIVSVSNDHNSNMLSIITLNLFDINSIEKKII